MAGTGIFCLDCGRKFIWSYEQQRYFRERDWNPPKYCRDCRSRRRYDRLPGMHVLAGPAPALLARGGLSWAEPPLCMPAPMPLWRQLPRAGYYRHLSGFLHMDPGAMTLLSVPEFALLMQWIFEQNSLETHHVAKRDGRLDLELTHRERHWDEFARCYLEGYEIPVDLGGDLAGKLKNTQVRRVHVCTLHTFTAAQRGLRNEFPLFLDIVEGEDLRRRLREAQQLCHARLARQRRAPLDPP